MSEPTMFQKIQMGAMMGGTVGMCLGLLLGTFQVIRFGGGSKGSLNTIATYMGSSAATFGFFMAVGSVIRTEGPEALRTTPLVPSQIPRQTLPWAFRARGLEELKVETLPRPERKH